ncbi:UTP--glucose-1-phosphate uridylyltransferase [Vibrio stylophorae]|uniref:UTP--glucose-1-phosphate uridylyltransferase n=1 Tax=Vibrio stylophorae TaxID=659351 RepID=A0ABN8DX33_9VIBR|nr:NDP-sugar synthase [Vibrio stylophorae]CAH0535174.1 UTP--glucose-1-phosphate uridylyltransferase [Vibrio stylophorae]
MKGMILAAGQGTRVKPVTQVIPKPMIPILGKPVMESMVELFAKHGIDEIMVNTSYLAQNIEDFFRDGRRYGVQLSYSREGYMKDGGFISKAMGSAGGMKKIQDFSTFFDGTFVVVCGDAWIDLDLSKAIAEHKAKGALASIVTKSVSPEEVSKYGIVVTNQQGRVTSFQEKPSPQEAKSDQASTGIYIFEPEIFDYIPSGEEYDIGSQLFPKLVRFGLPLYALNMDFQWLDVGSLTDIWEITTEILAGKVKGYPIPGQELRPGVWVGMNSVVSLECCDLKPPIVIGNGCLVEPGATIEGPVVLGSNCKIAEGAQVKNSLIGDYIAISSLANIFDKTIFGDYFISHDGFTQSLKELNAGDFIRDTRNVDEKPTELAEDISTLWQNNEGALQYANRGKHRKPCKV